MGWDVAESGLVWLGQPGFWVPIDLPGAAPFTVLNRFSTIQPEQDAGLNATSVWFDPGVDHPLAGSQVFLEHLVWIFTSHEHAAAQLFSAETRLPQ